MGVSAVGTTVGSGAKPTRDPGIRARIRGRGVDWGDPALFCRLSPMPFLMIGYTMNGCQNLNSRRASRGDYEKVVNQYPPFCASSSVNLGGLCVCGSSFSSFFVEIFEPAWRTLPGEKAAVERARQIHRVIHPTRDDCIDRCRLVSLAPSNQYD